jgi:hypothetical protein
VLAGAIGPAEPVSATGRAGADRIALEAATSRAAVAETGMPLEGVPGDTADRVLAPAAAVAPPAWDPEAEEASVGVAEGGGGRRPKLRNGNRRSTE